MAELYKVCLVFLVMQISIKFTTSTYDIRRGTIDLYSRGILSPKYVPKICGKQDYCSCGDSQSFIYDIDVRKGQCVKNSDFQNKLGCTPFLPFFGIFARHIEIIGQNLAPILQYQFFADGSCKWKKTHYSADGKIWLSTEDNLGNIHIERLLNLKTLQIDDPSVLRSTFPGMLLRVDVGCTTFTTTNEICLLLKIEGQTNITVYPDVTATAPTNSPTTVIKQFPDNPDASRNPKVSTKPAFTTKHSRASTPTTPIPRTTEKIQTKHVNTRSSQGVTNVQRLLISTTSILSDASDIKSHVTTAVPILPIMTASIPSDPKTNEGEKEASKSSDLQLILVPTLLIFCLLVVVTSIILYRKRRRYRFKSKNTDKGIDDDNTLPQNGARTNAARGSLPFYEVPDSQLNTTHIYETTDLPVANSTNYYERVEGNQRTHNDDVSTSLEPNHGSARHLKSQSTNASLSSGIYQYIDARPAVNCKDNFGYVEQSNEDPYYYSLEEDKSNDNIYDRVTDEKQEHVYNVLEEPK